MENAYHKDVNVNMIHPITFDWLLTQAICLKTRIMTNNELNIQVKNNIYILFVKT